MFVKTEERPHGEPQKVGTLKMSEAIRKGKPIVGVEHVSYKLCAIGCAWAGFNGRVLTNEDIYNNVGKFEGSWEERFAQAMGVPVKACEIANHHHCRGVPALVIADMLEAKGY